MTDIVERLRTWCHAVDAESAQDLMDEAANEIERLRKDAPCPHVRGSVTQYCSLNFTLTDEEREAIGYFAAFHRSPREGDANAAATLRNLLERLHT